MSTQDFVPVDNNTVVLWRYGILTDFEKSQNSKPLYEFLNFGIFQNPLKFHIATALNFMIILKTQVTNSHSIYIHH